MIGDGGRGRMNVKEFSQVRASLAPPSNRIIRWTHAEIHNFRIEATT